MKKDLSRRNFLKQTAGAASALAAAKTLFIPDTRLEAASYRAVAPSDTIRFGMIGIGMQGSGLLTNAVQLPGVECVAAADLYDGRHTLAREIVGNPNLPVTRRYKDLLDNKEIDCLIAAVPDHWHKQVVVDAVRAGKDIYCEKPMSHTPSDGLEMVKAGKATGRVIQIGSPSATSRWSRAPSAAMILTAHGNIRRPSISLRKRSIGKRGKAPSHIALGIPTCLPNISRVGAAGRNTARESPATCSSTSSAA